VLYHLSYGPRWCCGWRLQNSGSRWKARWFARYQHARPLTGLANYMDGLIKFAQAVVPGSSRDRERRTLAPSP
jgi:hypothetical protein